MCALAAGYLYSEEDWLTALETEESSMAGQSAHVCVCVYVCLCVLIVCVMPLVSVCLCVCRFATHGALLNPKKEVSGLQ